MLRTNAGSDSSCFCIVELKFSSLFKECLGLSNEKYNGFAGRCHNISSCCCWLQFLTPFAVGRSAGNFKFHNFCNIFLPCLPPCINSPHPCLIWAASSHLNSLVLSLIFLSFGVSSFPRKLAHLSFHRLAFCFPSVPLLVSPYQLLIFPFNDLFHKCLHLFSNLDTLFPDDNVLRFHPHCGSHVKLANGRKTVFRTK